MTQHPKAEAARKAVERMEAERVMVHGIEVKPGQVWACSVGNPSRIASVGSPRAYEPILVCEMDDPDDTTEWSIGEFADAHPRLYLPEAIPAPAAPERWTDAEWAAEQVALARRQAEVARAEARELWLLVTSAVDESAKLTAQLAEARETNSIVLSEYNAEVGTLTAQLAEARAALEAARAAVHSPSQGGSDPARSVLTYAQIRDAFAAGPAGWRKSLDDTAAEDEAERPIGAEGPWSPPVLTMAEARALLDEGSEVGKAVRKRLDRMERAVAESKPGGTDPATRTRALPVVPAQPTECWTCEHEAGSYCYHPAHPLPAGYREIAGRMPPDWCPLRELAKAGGA